MRRVNTPQELTAREANAQAWDVPPGHWKRQCDTCGYFFATPSKSSSAVCPTCAGKGKRRGKAA